VPLVGQKTRSLYEILTRLFITEVVSNDFSVITSRVNISCREQVVWLTKATGGLQHNFLIFNGNSTLKIFGSVDVKITPISVLK
jgi:hypothetical protein